MNTQQTLLKSITALLALVPGLSILITNLGVPDDSYKLIFGAVIQAFGCAILLMLHLNRNTLTEIDNVKKTRIALVALVVFFVGLVLYLVLYNACVVLAPNGQVFFPLFIPKIFQDEIAIHNGKVGYVYDFGIDGARIEIKRIANFQLIATIIIFLVTYIVALGSLVFCFGILTTKTDGTRDVGKTVN
jgi:uncharacterized membrane protein YiaA